MCRSQSKGGDVDQWKLIQALRKGPIAESKFNYPIVKWDYCQGKCRRWWRVSELVNGLCWACDVPKEEICQL